MSKVQQLETVTVCATEGEARLIRLIRQLQNEGRPVIIRVENGVVYVSQAVNKGIIPLVDLSEHPR